MWRNLFWLIFMIGLNVGENESSLQIAVKSRGRKLFGGYRITPRICKPSITVPNSSEGPTICMFNHECIQRNGQVVGACMDGFLFGACCQLPKDAVIGDLVDSDLMSLPSAPSLDNSLASKTAQTTHRTTPAFIDITSSGVSQITAALLNENTLQNSASTIQDKYNEIIIEGASTSMLPGKTTSKQPFANSSPIPDFNGNTVIQVNNNGQDVWPATGVQTVLNFENDEINSSKFNPTKRPSDTSKSTTPRTNSFSETYPAPMLQVYTPVPIIQKPLFRPKPPQIDENYVLVPTISHGGSTNNKIDEIDPVSYVITQLNQSVTEKPISTYSYVSSSLSPFTRRPASTTRKPPSTSYVFSSTIPPRKTEITTSSPVKVTSANQLFANDRFTSNYGSSSTSSFASTSSAKPPSTSYVYSSSFKPTKSPKPPSTSYIYSSSFKPTSTKKPPSTSYVYSSTKPTKPTSRYPTNRPTAHSTWANSPDAFPGSSSTFEGTYSSTPNYSGISPIDPNRQPPTSVTSNVVGPSFSVSSESLQYSPFPSPAPTLIVLGPVSGEEYGQSRPTEYVPVPTRQQTTSTIRPQPSQLPSRKPVNGVKPVNSVVVNNHVVQNIYGGSQRPNFNTPTSPGSGVSTYTQSPLTSSTIHQDLPSPTVLITPKPTLTSSYQPLSDDEEEVVTTLDETIDFPPDRHPNLNHSAPTYSKDDITTPTFIENEEMNEKVESFVNQIIYGLQEPFNDLKDIVYSNGTSAVQSNSVSTTKKPIKKQGTTTKKPPTKPTSVKTTTRKSSTTRRPATTTTTRRVTTTKRTVPTKKAQTTTPNLIDTTVESESYRDQCGVRPLMRQAKIVGGKGAVFGEFPWQVLVRESTWLGLFTKNKCGGVLIGEKYVMTAAHCQPGILASLIAVFGEFDISGDLESRKPISRNVRRVIVHRKYDAATFENDLALLELESPVTFDAHIIPICLPRENEDFTGRMATVTGWGRLRYGGGVPSVLQEVQVPIMENHVCQEMFRTAGHSKVILESFLCAGYANGQKDSCEGDSGGPLVLQRPDGRYQLAGTVSHGIKCAAPYLPGVYMRTAYYKPWITSITGIE